MSLLLLFMRTGPPIVRLARLFGSQTRVALTGAQTRVSLTGSSAHITLSGSTE